MNWRASLLLVVSMLLLVLTVALSHVDQPEGIIFLGSGPFFAAILSFFWYLFRPDAGWSDSRKFFSFLAANVILFVLFGFLVSHVPAVGAVFGGLFAVVLAYTVWSQVVGESQGVGESILDLMQNVFKTFLILLTILGIAFTLEGLAMLTGIHGLSSIAREIAKIFGGS